MTKRKLRKRRVDWITLSIWAAAIVLALGGGVWYLLTGTDKAWWVGGLAVLPLLLLIGSRDGRDGRRVPDGDDSGGWAPP